MKTVNAQTHLVLRRTFSKSVASGLANELEAELLTRQLHSLDHYVSVSRLKNSCFYVGRARSFNRSLFISRHTIRRFVRFGMLPGFIKERC
jgi:ribosomal protein S14